MIIRWNQQTRSHALLQSNLTHFGDWIDSYAEACENISPQQNQRIRANNSRRGPPDVSCQLCSQHHNLDRCSQYLENSVYDRQFCIRRFNPCPNCLSAHEKGLCQSKTRCFVDRCNGFHHSTLHRTDARQQQQQKTKSTTKRELKSVSQKNTFRNQTNQNKTKYGRNNENQRQQTSSNYNQQDRNINKQCGSNSSTSHRGNRNKKGIHRQPMNTQNNNKRQQSNNQRTVVEQQATTPQLNYNSSNQQEISLIRPQIQLQVIPLKLFNRDLCVETYGLLDSGSDNTQITQKISDALQFQQPTDITPPLASLLGEYSVKTADVMVSIGVLYSSFPVIRIPVSAPPEHKFSKNQGLWDRNTDGSTRNSSWAVHNGTHWHAISSQHCLVGH